MAQEHLTNNQFFRKYRLKDTRPPSDYDVVCHGNLIMGVRPPEKFYKGWYPIRHQCSFPDHEPQRRAGLKNSKSVQFRNYRIICDICDHPANQLPPPAQEPSRNFLCKPNSVAPKCEQDSAPTTEAYKKCRDKVDAYWRYHDPHYCEPSTRMPASCKVHSSNWFKDEMEMAGKYQQYQKLCQSKEPVIRMERECKTNYPVDFESQRRLCLQQMKNSACKTPLNVQASPAAEQPVANSQPLGSGEMIAAATPGTATPGIATPAET